MPPTTRQEKHLTPAGWIDGTAWKGTSLVGPAIERPPDTVETWLHCESRTSRDAEPEWSWKRIWVLPGVDPDILKAIRSSYLANDEPQLALAEPPLPELESDPEGAPP